MGIKSKLTQDGNTLILEIDISPKAREAAVASSSGKTLVVASTRGFRDCEGVDVSLNCTIPNRDYVAPKTA